MLLWVLAMGSWLLQLLCRSKIQEELELIQQSSDELFLDTRRGVAVFILALTLILTAVTSNAGHSTARLVKITMPMQGLPECLSGYTVAMLSDVHAGPLVGAAEMGEFVARLNALNADTQVLVGDMGEGSPVGTNMDEMQSISDLDAPDGVYLLRNILEYNSVV